MDRHILVSRFMVFASLIVVFIFYILSRLNISIWGDTDYKIGLCTDAFFFVPIIFLLCTFKCFWKLGDKKAIGFLGSISYSLYVIHFPYQMLLDTVLEICKIRHTYDSVYFWAFYSITVIGLAAICHTFIEEPLKKHIRRIL